MNTLKNNVRIMALAFALSLASLSGPSVRGGDMPGGGYTPPPPGGGTGGGNGITSTTMPEDAVDPVTAVILDLVTALGTLF